MAMYNSHIVDLIYPTKHSCNVEVSLQRGMRSKVQHVQRDLPLEIQHLMMLCIRGVSVLFSFLFHVDFCQT